MRYRDKIGVATAVAIALALAGACLLYLNRSDMAVLSGIGGAYTATWIACAGGFAFAVMSLGFQLCMWGKRWWDKNKEDGAHKQRQHDYEAKLLSMLDLLSAEEERTLAWMVQNNTNTILGETGTRVLHSLVTKGLLQQATGTGELFNWPHLPPDFVWEELQRQRTRYMAVNVDGHPWRIHWMAR